MDGQSPTKYEVVSIRIVDMLHTNHQQRRILAFPAAILEFGWNPVSPTASKHSIMPSIPVVIYLLVLELLQMGADSSPKLSRFDLHGCTFGSHPLAKRSLAPRQKKALQSCTLDPAGKCSGVSAETGVIELILRECIAQGRAEIN
ncbi:MAG: hypothetical protein LQ340_001738 [Diploschistes diacapsis]|nr:MAG: hypothetical protein LQ340_001738 [Diploschistes diacapsis]